MLDSFHSGGPAAPLGHSPVSNKSPAMKTCRRKLRPVLMLEVRCPACVIGHGIRAPVVLALELRPRRPIPLRDALPRRAEDVLRGRGAAHRSPYPLVLGIVNILRRLAAIHLRDVAFRVEGVAVEAETERTILNHVACGVVLVSAVGDLIVRRVDAQLRGVDAVLLQAIAVAVINPAIVRPCAECDRARGQPVELVVAVGRALAKNRIRGAGQLLPLPAVHVPVELRAAGVNSG